MPDDLVSRHGRGRAPAEAKRAKVTHAPYVWALTIRGQVSLGQLSLPLKAVPGQIASGIRAGVMGNATVEKDRVFVATEVIAVDFRRRQFAPILSQDVAARAISIKRVAGYAQIVELRPFLGVRYNDLKADIGVIPVNLAVAGHWAEPLLNSVAIVRPNRKWTFTAKIDRGLVARGGVRWKYAVTSIFASTAEYRYSQDIVT